MLQWLFLTWATFVLGGLAVLFMRKARMKRAVLSWPETVGEILSAEVRKGRNIYSSLSGPIWGIPHFTYRYVVNGRTYVGDRVYVFRDTNAYRPHVAREIVDSKPVGSRVPVYYDPTDPSKSCLERKPNAILDE